MLKIIGLILIVIFVLFVLFIILALVVFNRDVNKRIKNRSALKRLEINSKTINNEQIDSKIFLENDITMVNIWGTYCGSCVEELKDLQEIHKEYEKIKVGVLGIIFDVNTENPKEKVMKKAIELLKENKITYPNILLDHNLKEEIKDKVFYVPTTIFVDKNGMVIGDIIEKACSKTEYVEKIERILNANIKNKNESIQNEADVILRCNLNGVCNNQKLEEDKE